ncbi:DNA-binding response regulator [Siminovitchia terrae]|uniref:DNA-binding response regulator n=1 Tax=Siminovitchia terrae TaxID=1914933 RepID=A0A429X5K7_SIMTE|nr:response regulator transcription factor [Siminovitchia terrae]RST58687.1 response regulator transcription factor [Siminovitchia terrae]GIN90039.1 DNA-binding response regulator [Siminovitchia terrae]GIN94439.1 DNA-binding response regulator [Siminovitchia terrae]
MRKILIVDDEERMRNLISLYLSPAGYECVPKASGAEAVSYLSKKSCALIILDVMMPDMDGWETCKRIREISDVPIIMLTARTDKSDIVKGLGAGADDYITKPFDSGELLARIEAIFRRAKLQEDTKISFNGLTWNPDSYSLNYQNKPIQITPKEFSLIGLLLKNPNRVFTRDQLLTIIWGLEAGTEDRTIDSHIRNIRDKLRNAGFPIDYHLTTVWGVGYKWENE